MAKEHQLNEKDVKSVQDINRSFVNGIDNLYTRNGYVPDHYHELDQIGREIDNIINSELNGTKSITTDEMSTFLVKTFNDMDRNQNNTVNSLDDIFLSKETGLEEFFQERYQNQNLLYDDLNMICQHLPELDEAVLTTRDAIVTSDDISRTVSRTISFADTLDSDQNINAYMGVVEQMERDLGLPKKIKGQITTNLLKYGKYYVYTIPYEKLFEQQYKYKLQNPNLTGGDSLKESLTEASCVSLKEVANDDEYYTSFKNDLKAISKDIISNESSLQSTMESYCENITVTNDIYSIPLIEGTDVTQILSSEKFKELAEKIEKEREKNSSVKSFNDGIMDMDKKVEGKFKGVKGCFIKFIDPRRIVPVKVLDTTLGYYYIHETQLRRDRAPFSTTIRLTNSVGSGTYADDVEACFMQRITDKIVNAFDPKYVEKNQKFKDMILNALVYNDMYSKRINFQFIPAEYMTEFNINEDEKGEGQSVLLKALFYAKLYLALLVFKMISMLTRSNDTRVYYIKNGGIDTNITNKINDVARSIKAKQINFMDLLNYNSIISKVGAFKDVFMPVGRSGERGIEFDTIAGQNVEWNNDIMEFLKTNMISATGKLCPII